jgi:hypothetical protein
MLDAPENKFLLPLEKEKERARLFADVLVVYGKMMMGREDLVSPFEGRSRLSMRGDEWMELNLFGVFDYRGSSSIWV